MCLLLIAVPGYWYERLIWQGEAVFDTAHLEHGWPWPFLRRDIRESRHGYFYPFAQTIVYIPWMAPDAWVPGRRESRDWNAAALIADVVVCGGIVAGLGMLLERWRRRGGRVWQWSLRRMLVGLFLVASVLGWIVAVKHRQREDGAIYAQFKIPNDAYTKYDSSNFSAGIQWLDRLTLLRPLMVRTRLGKHGLNTKDAEAIAKFSALKDLEVSNLGQSPFYADSISDEDRLNFAPLKELKSLRTIRLIQGNFDDHAFQSLANLTQLEELRIHFGFGQLNDRQARCLRPLTRLTTLAIDDTEISDDGLLQLEHMRRLEKLYVRRTMVGGSAFERLSHLPLRSLRLRECPVFDGRTRSIARVSTLRYLDLRKTYVTDEALEFTDGLRRLPELFGLRLGGTKVTGVGFQEWADAPLEMLDVSDCPISSLGLDCIAKLKNLVELDLSGSPVKDSDFPRLRSLSNLKTLYLDKPSPANPGLAELQRALPKLKVIDLQRGYFGGSMM